MKIKKLCSLLLLLSVLLSTLAVLTSCTDPGNQDPNDGKPLEGDGWYSEVDFRGESIRIDQSVTVSNTSTTIDSGSKYTKGPDQKGEDEVQNLCYDRNRTVLATLNLKVDYNTPALAWNEILDYYDPLFSMDQLPDLIINDVYAVVPMTLNGQLVNVKNQDSAKFGQNYFNFDAKVGKGNETCWYNDFMEGLTIDENKVYAVAGNYFFDMLRMAHCLYLNTDLFATSVAPNSEWQTVADFYEHVENRRFTYYDLSQMSVMAWQDSGRQQGISDIGDVVGFLCHTGSGLYPFVFGAEISVVEEGADGLQINASSKSISDMTEQLLSVTTAVGTLPMTGEVWDEMRDKFVSGEALFVNSFWMGDLEHSDFKNLDNKAPIVYPMTERLQGEYLTYVHDSAEIGYIPKNVQNANRFTRASAFLQLSCELSSPIIDVYFEEALKYGENTDAAAVPMLDVIHETLSPSFNQVIVNQIADLGGAEYTVLEIVGRSVAAGQDKTATLYEANRYAYEEGLRQLIQKFNGMK